jgi:TatA/E family protein of Tat protein translocase
MISAVLASAAVPLAFLDMLGGSEVMVILLLVLVFFGGEKMPEFARGLGKAIREFRKAASSVEDEFKRAMEEDPALTKNPPPATLPASLQAAPTIMPPKPVTPTAPPASLPPAANPPPAPSSGDHHAG